MNIFVNIYISYTYNIHHSMISNKVQIAKKVLKTVNLHFFTEKNENPLAFVLKLWYT